MNNNFNVNQEFINILNNWQLTKEEFESEIVNLIDRIDSFDDLLILSDLIYQLGENFEDLGFDGYEINDRYNLSDAGFDYQNDVAIVKLIFNNALFQKINNLESDEEKINLIDKVFLLVDNLEYIRGYSVMFLAENITPEIFNNYSFNVQSCILSDIIDILNIEEDFDVVDMFIESLFENIYKFNLNDQELIEFTNLILTPIQNNLEDVDDIDRIMSAIEEVFNNRGIRIDEALNNRGIIANQAFNNNRIRINEARIRLNEGRIRLNEAKIRLNEAGIIIHEAINGQKTIFKGSYFNPNEPLVSLLKNILCVQLVDIEDISIYRDAVKCDSIYRNFLNDKKTYGMQLELAKKNFLDKLAIADDKTKESLLDGIAKDGSLIIWYVEDKNKVLHNINMELKLAMGITSSMLIDALEQRQTNQENMQEQSEYEDVVAMPVNTQPRVFASDEEKALEEQLHNERMNFIKSVSKSYNKRKARVAKSKRILNKPRLKTSRRLNGNRKAKDNSRYL